MKKIVIAFITAGCVVFAGCAGVQKSAEVEQELKEQVDSIETEESAENGGEAIEKEIMPEEGEEGKVEAPEEELDKPEFEEE